MLRPLAETIIQGPDFRGRRRLLKLLFRGLAGRPIRSRYGPLMCLRPDDYTNQCAVIGMDHVDYDDVFNEVSQMTSGMAFIDIGANAGLFSMVAGSRVGPSGAVVAFEPSIRIFRDLVDNAVMNGLANFYPINAAIGSSLGLARFASDETRHSGGGHLDAEGTVQVLQVDGFVYGPILHTLIGDRPTVIKIDVEGAEDLVVGALHDLLARHQVQKVIAEIDPRYLERFGTSAAGLYEKFERAGLRPRRGLNAAAHYNEIFER